MPYNEHKHKNTKRYSTTLKNIISKQVRKVVQTHASMGCQISEKSPWKEYPKYEKLNNHQMYKIIYKNKL